jgi:hypothetical protein
VFFLDAFSRGVVFPESNYCVQARGEEVLEEGSARNSDVEEVAVGRRFTMLTLTPHHLPRWGFAKRRKTRERKTRIERHSRERRKKREGGWGTKNLFTSFPPDKLD